MPDSARSRCQFLTVVPRDRLAACLARLYLGLADFGVSLAQIVRARLGLGPWDVLHQGIARHLGVQLRWVAIGVSGPVLLDGSFHTVASGDGPGTSDPCGLLTAEMSGLAASAVLVGREKQMA
jgi:hypothetical protein